MLRMSRTLTTNKPALQHEFSCIASAVFRSTHSIHKNDHNDLVREVIEENPPRAQGIRPEWEVHRKENLRTIIMVTGP